MNAPYDNTNTGILSRNDLKEPGSKQPDYKGDLNIGGTEYRLAGWTTARKNGSGFFLSLKVEPKEAKPAPQRAAQPADEDFPF